MGDVTLAVPMAGRGRVGFVGTARAAIVMGDLAVTPAELGPVEAELLRQRLDVSAIHDHLVGEEPRLAFVHFEAAGAAVDLARRLDAVLARTGTPRPVTPAVVPPVTIDTAVVGAGLGPGGRAQGSVVQYDFQLVRRRVRWRGRVLPPALAAASPVNVQAVNPTRAVATGAFVLLAGQVEPVLRAFAAHGVAAEALHTHLAGASPAMVEVRFWADGPLAAVVRGLEAALDAARAAR